MDNSLEASLGELIRDVMADAWEQGYRSAESGEPDNNPYRTPTPEDYWREDT